MSWLQGPGSWPRRAGNAPNTLLPPIAKGREAPSERPFCSDSQTKFFTLSGWEMVEKKVLLRDEPRKHCTLNGLVRIR